ncbi:DUF309 domain-containing protein [Pueribacillus theae]|uniref:DUF309 domain-containing protein n=1 Tax=Pueribacillus theae TaxID=2171751 RepID=UPI001F0CDA3C|nr:DUF309 domain-containing protein [Pueribacillus theae]
MPYPEAYIRYLVYFHGLRDYFECHEVLEEHWKKDEKENRKKYWVGLIQIAVALYHQRRKNFKGAEKLMKNAINIIRMEKEAIHSLSLDYSKLLLILETRYREMLNKQEYTSIHLPIISNQLIELCKKECKKLNCIWGSESNLKNDELVHKHMLRDRSERMKERGNHKERREATRKH